VRHGSSRASERRHGPVVAKPGDHLAEIIRFLERIAPGRRLP
jgi:hypothetical protein